MINAALAKLIVERSGLNLDEIVCRNIARTAAAAMERAGLGSLDAYLERLRTSAAEWTTMIEALVVPETWFFRDHEPFLFLKEHVRRKWLLAPPQHRLRILSVPCSTGEEPYSIAITLLQAGLTPDRFHIDAVDISQHAIAAAQQAIYSDRSFREQAAHEASCYFLRQAAGWVLDKLIVQLVDFRTANLVDPGFLDRQPPYHLIFCRNMIIYLTASARNFVLKNLARLLGPQGILIVGHSELTFFQRAGYSPISHARSFACQRTGLAP